MRTPSPLPAPALWGEPHRWGWAKGRALRLGPSASASSAAQPRARGLQGGRAPVWISGRWARAQTSGKETTSARGPGSDGAGNAFLRRRCRDRDCWRLPPPGSAWIFRPRQRANQEPASLARRRAASVGPLPRRGEGGAWCGGGRGGNAPERAWWLPRPNPEWLEGAPLVPAFLGRARI